MTEGEGIAPIPLEIIAARIVAGAREAILYTDREGIIRLWNGGCERIFGFTTTEARNQTPDIIIPENLRQRHWRGHTETMRTGRTKYGRGDLLAVPALRKDGVRISVEFSISRLGTRTAPCAAWPPSCGM